MDYTKLKNDIKKNIGWLHRGEPIKDGDPIEIPDNVIDIIIDVVKFNEEQ